MVLELGRARRRRARVRTRGGMLVCEARCEHRRALATGPEALARRAEGNQPAIRVAGAARQLAEGTVDALPLEPDRLEPRLRLDRRRPLDGRHQRMGVPRALGGLAALRGRVARRAGGLARRVLERTEGLVRSGALGTLGLRQVVPQPRGERRPSTPRERRAAPPRPGAGRGRRRPPRDAPAASDSSTSARSRSARTDESLSCVERRASAAALPPLLDLAAPLVERPEVDPREPSMQRDDLARELLGTLGGGRLQRQRTEPLADLVLDVARPLDLRRDPCELQLGAVPASLELPETCGLLDERPPVLGPRREDGVDLALRDDRVHRSTEPDVGEQLDEVGAPHGRAVDEVLALAAADEAALDRDLAEVELVAEAAVLVVEDELDLAVLGGRAIAAAGEEDVVGLLGAHLRRRQRARRPDDRVGHVRLPGAVRSDHDRDPGLEGHLDGVGERLEAAQLDAPQVHASATLSAAADGDGEPHPRGPARTSRTECSRLCTVTLTDAVCVVGRPFVLSTILNCAVPLAALDGIESTVDLPAATLTAALPLTVPLRLAVAETCAGQATPVSVYFSLATALGRRDSAGDRGRARLRAILGEPNDGVGAAVVRVQVAGRPDRDVLRDQIGDADGAEHLAGRRDQRQVPLRDVRHPQVAVEVDADADRRLEPPLIVLTARSATNRLTLRPSTT